MPVLDWPGKHLPEQVPGEIHLNSRIFPGGRGYPDQETNNQLIYGDNLKIMSALMQAYQGKINLIYADPPFFTNRQYPARIGQGEDSRRPAEWQLSSGYPDDWMDVNDYLDMLYPRLKLMYQLLSETGTLYLHLDWHANAYARLLLDEIFGAEQLLNEIVWVYHGPSPIRTAYNRKHDTLLVYTKSSKYTFNVDAVREPYHPNTVKTFQSSPKAGFGKVPNLERGKVPEDWWYFPVVARLHAERTGYPTQKPKALLERIIIGSSNPGDLVADFFCGSGTTLVVAAEHGRNFIGSDITWRAIQTTLSRLVGEKNPPFELFFEADSSPPRMKIPEIQVFRSGDQTFTLTAPDLSEIIYWEVDPVGKSGIFQSARQALRPRKKGEIATHLEVDKLAPGENIKARVFTNSGELIEIQVK
jgi:DNA modification methylase